MQNETCAFVRYESYSVKQNPVDPHSNPKRNGSFRFNREPSVMNGYTVLSSGFVRYTFDDHESVDLLMELLVPICASVSFAKPIYLALYASGNQWVLIATVILTDGTNKASFDRVSSDAIIVGLHTLHFESDAECKIWHVLITDVTSAQTRRLNELLDLKHPHAPRGYRTQFAELHGRVVQNHRPDRPPVSENVPSIPSLLSEALACIDYLSTRLYNCRCSNNISLEMEDTVYETRSKLFKFVHNQPS